MPTPNISVGSVQQFFRKRSAAHRAQRGLCAKPNARLLLLRLTWGCSHERRRRDSLQRWRGAAAGSRLRARTHFEGSALLGPTVAPLLTLWRPSIVDVMLPPNLEVPRASGSTVPSSILPVGRQSRAWLSSRPGPLIGMDRSQRCRPLFGNLGLKTGALTPS